MTLSGPSIERPHLSPISYPARALETNFVALSGVSCSGKSTMGSKLVQAGFARMPETMRLWMDGLRAQGIEIQALKNADPVAFRRDLFEVAHSIVEQQALLDPKQALVFNRPGIDALVFMKVDGLDYSCELARMRAGPRFKAICLFEPLPFIADGTRVPDPVLRARQQVAFHEIVAELGYQPESIIIVPASNPSGNPISINERIRFLLKELRLRGCQPIYKKDGDTWGEKSQEFSLRVDPSTAQIDLTTAGFGVSANVLIAWKAIHAMAAAESHALGRPLEILDFGCGSAGLGQQLSHAGHSVLACDASPAMIRTARLNSPFDVRFARGGVERLEDFAQRDIITATLVTNYLPELESFAHAAAKCVRIGGLVSFVELNPEYVKTCLRLGMTYSDPEPVENPRFATLSFEGGRERLTLWSSAEYIAAFGTHGMRLVSETLLPNTPELVSAHGHKTKVDYPFEVPRYRMFTFRRSE